MKLKNIGANETEIDLGLATVLFSYNTPVAARLDNGALVKTNYKHSQTTTRHINKWLQGREAIERDQSYLDNLINYLTS